MRPRRLLIASIACLALIGAPAAHGADGTASGGWYWVDQVTPPAGTVQQKVPSPDVPAGDLAVSARNGDSNKETYLHLADDLLQPGDKVSSLVVTLKQDSAGGNVNDTNALIVAVPVTDFWVDGAQGDPYAVKPPRATTPAIVGKSSSSTWTFDITPIAEQWASGTLQNNGIALVPKDGSGATFEVVWSPKPTVAADITPGSTSAGTDAGATAGGSSSSSGGTDASTTGSGSSTNVSPSLGTGGGDLSTPTGGSSGSVTPSAPAASATTAPAAVPSLRRTRASHPGRGIPATFFIAVILVAGLLAGVMVSLGPLGEPAAARKGSVLRRLERRPDTAT